MWDAILLIQHAGNWATPMLFPTKILMASKLYHHIGTLICGAHMVTKIRTGLGLN
jgi:hypothetical protein